MHAETQAIPAAPIERIGVCDLCGLVDHHLVLGACPSCNDRRHLLVEPPAHHTPDNAGTAGQE